MIRYREINGEVFVAVDDLAVRAQEIAGDMQQTAHLLAANRAAQVAGLTLILGEQAPTAVDQAIRKAFYDATLAANVFEVLVADLKNQVVSADVPDDLSGLMGG